MNKCNKCGSENIYFSKKRNLYVCEDCNHQFKDEIAPQKVFLSYGHDENQPLVFKIYEALHGRGHIPWIDRSKIKAGSEWRSKISNGINESNFFVSCISNHSVRIPGVCLDEIAIALSQKSCRIFTILLEKNVSVPNSISNIQWLDMSDWKEHYRLGGDDWDLWFQDKINRIFEAIEDPENIRYAGDIDMLQSKLNPISMDLKMKLLLQDNLIGRKWLLNEVRAFVNNDKRSVFWLTGAPGSGKSAFAAMMSNYLELCAAVYFCQWDKTETLDAKNIIKSIAFQLACNLSDYRGELIAVLSRFDMTNCSAESAFERLLVEPLNSLIDGGRENTCVVIDAIDELEESNFEFVKIFNRLLLELPSWIKFVITSRFDERLKNMLLRYDHCVFSLDGEYNLEDIKAFASENLTNEHLVDVVCEKSNNSFLLAREYIRILKENQFDIDSISGINGAITDIYLNTFNRLFATEDYKPYKSFLEVCLSCLEPPSIELMAEILGTTESNIIGLVDKLSSLMVILPYKNKNIIQPRHKTLIDWITSTAAERFKLDLKNGNMMLTELYFKELSNDNDDINEYFVKYGLSYLNAKRAAVLFPVVDKKKILSKLASNAHKYGYKQVERAALDRWAGLSDTDDLDQLMAELDYAIRFMPNRILDLCNKVRPLISLQDNEKNRFKYTNYIATALFYVGNDVEALELIKTERTAHDPVFWMNSSLDSEYWHTISLVSHDLDKNDDVIQAATNSADLYDRMGKKYSTLISLVNLFDGYMAVGNLTKAHEIAKTVSDELNVRYYVHVDDIFHICYANLLLTEGRLMEAFAEYEIGISLAKNIQNWDWIYGKIWYALALADFHDETSISILQNLADEAELNEYKYLFSLSLSFWAYACHKNGKVPNRQAYADAKLKVLREGKPGHIATLIAAGILMGLDDDFDSAIDRYLACSGGKGCLSLANALLQICKNRIDVQKYEAFSNWVKRYWQPIEEYRTQYRLMLMSDLTENVLLPRRSCADCESKCCYDGVYLFDDEIVNIMDFVAANRKYFEFLPKKYIVEGDWEGLKQYKKTEKRPYTYSTAIPSHFTQTRCVFALENGKCSLQSRAVELFLHPWKYKPTACWVFPLTGCRNGKILPPPTSPQDDENNLGPSYPGYASLMPCVAGEGVESWKDCYINEIEYFKYSVKSKK